MKGFMEGILFRPQGKPMAYPYTLSAKISQFPWRHYWHESFMARYGTYSILFLILPMYWKINKSLTSPENKKFWKEKRKHDAEHHHAELVKKWEVRT